MADDPDNRQVVERVVRGGAAQAVSRVLKWLVVLPFSAAGQKDRAAHGFFVGGGGAGEEEKRDA